jgi:hypothetical protein
MMESADFWNRNDSPGLPGVIGSRSYCTTFSPPFDEISPIVGRHGFPTARELRMPAGALEHQRRLALDVLSLMFQQPLFAFQTSPIAGE